MIRLRDEELVRSIGASNFAASHIRRLERETGVVPALNQIEMHPAYPLRWHVQLGVVPLPRSGDPGRPGPAPGHPTPGYRQPLPARPRPITPTGEEQGPYT